MKSNENGDNTLVFFSSSVLLKTLIVMGIAKETTAETLKSAFDGALSARVAVDKETGVSKGCIKFSFNCHHLL